MNALGSQSDRRQVLYLASVSAAVAVLAVVTVVVTTIRGRAAQELLEQARIQLDEGRLDTAERLALVVTARYRRWSEQGASILGEIDADRRASDALFDAERAADMERAFEEQTRRFDELTERFSGFEESTSDLQRDVDLLDIAIARERIRTDQLMQIAQDIERGVRTQQAQTAVLADLIVEATPVEPPTPDEALAASELVSEGIGYYRAGALTRAEETLLRALDINPRDERASAYLAAVIYAANPLDNERRRIAIRLAQNSTTSGEAAVVAQYTLGQIYDQENVPERAIEAYEEVLSLHPTHVPANYAMGRLMFQDGRLEDADEHWSRVATALPDDQDVRFDLLRLAVERGDWRDVVEYGEELETMGNRLPATYASLAEAQRELGNCEGAIVHWRYAYELNPRWQYLAGSAECMAETDDRIASAELYLEAVEEHPRNSEAARDEAYRLVESAVAILSDPQPTRRTLNTAERGAELLGDDVRGYLLLARVHEEMGNVQRASRVYRELVDTGRAVNGVYTSLARTYLSLDDDVQRAEDLLRDVRRSGNELEYREIQQLIAEHIDG